MKKRIFVLVLAILMLCTAFVGCTSSGNGKGTTIQLLTRGWINIPTDENDPYKKWISENYGLNINLEATADINGRAPIAFASNNKPDLVAFPDLNSFNKIKKEGVLLDDWTPFLDKMPKMKSFIESADQQSLRYLFTEDGKLKALWITPNSTTWSLKIREDWAEEYRAETVPGEDNYYPAGATASTDPETGEQVPWYPYTPDDLLNFARWIKVNKNSDPKSLDYFGFTASGSGMDFGTFTDWVPMMWGYVAMPPYGFYEDPVTKEANYFAQNGMMEPVLNYMRTIVDEQLIDPNWFVQTPSQDTRTKAGKIGITWYTSVISEMTANYNPDKDTIDWWKTYDIPCADPDSPIGGSMLTDSVASSIITVSAATALNTEKMDKICKLLDDIVCYVDETKEGPEKYVRGKAYDALKWGVGVDGDLKFEPIEDSEYMYCCVKTGNTYRETAAGVGAWDWGAWFSTSNDGIIQGESETIDPIVMKSVEHNMATASYSKRLQEGSFVHLDTTKINNIKTELVSFMYKYVTRDKSLDMTIKQFENYFKNNLYGTELLNQVTEQFKELGFIK